MAGILDLYILAMSRCEYSTAQLYYALHCIEA